MYCFNTTLVTVYLIRKHNRAFGGTRFNTTLVTVYPNLLKHVSDNRTFQYNPCYCLSSSSGTDARSSSGFQYNPCYCLSVLPSRLKGMTGQVSIQPLLLFIKEKNKWLQRKKKVSIQPLLLFIEMDGLNTGDVSAFQYNPCYCLSQPFKGF